MLEIEVQTVRYFPAEDGERGIEYETGQTQQFQSVEECATWLIMEEFDTAFSAGSFEPEGYWSTPLYVQTLSGMHEEHAAHPTQGMHTEDWRAVYDQLQTVKTA